MTTVYLAGPIAGCNDDEAHGWRDAFVASFEGYDFDFKDPMVRDYRGREDECFDEIIGGDEDDIDASDIFLAYAWQPSWGTAMEIHYAYKISGCPVIVVVPEGQRISPWVRGHADHIFSSLAEAREHLIVHSLVKQ